VTARCVLSSTAHRRHDQSVGQAGDQDAALLLPALRQIGRFRLRAGRTRAPAGFVTRFALAAVAALGIGCVTTYQPLSGLHRPTVVDPAVSNFEDVSVTLVCSSSDYLDGADVSALCARLETLYANQGALVQTAGSTSFAEDEAPGAAALRSTDLVVDVRARLLDENSNGWLWFFSLATLSLSPVISEFTFAQDVEIRDRFGVLLMRDTLKGRFVRYGGLGPWGTNAVMNWFRESADEIHGDDTAKKIFSSDFEKQMSQILFNAKMRWLVLRESAAEEPRRAQNQKEGA